MNQLVKEVAAVMLGGGLGAVARFLLSSRVQMTTFGQHYPWAPILVVNLLGCFIIGVLYAIFESSFDGGVVLRLLIFTGLLGGFTTFSSVSLDVFKLLSQGDVFYGVMNFMLSLGGGVILCSVGATITQFIINRM